MKADALGQITTLATLIAAYPSINQQTKLEAHTLAANAKLWAAGKVDSHTLADDIEHLTQDIRLLVS